MLEEEISKPTASQIEAWEISRLIPNARNARTHSDKQIHELAGSIQAFGFIVPVLVDHAGVILAGHARVLAAQKLGLPRVPVPRAWTQVLRPSLADREGRALFIGTPQGFNHFYTLFTEAQTLPDWEAFQYTTEEGGNVALAELESATHELDERTYRQEFQAKFENLTAGLAYYSFERKAVVQKIEYVPGHPLFWSLDFNINPMCSIIGQHIDGVTRVLKELALPDSRTRDACKAFLAQTEDWTSESDWPLEVKVYGDATGQGRKSSASQTDWQIVREFFASHTELFKATYYLRSCNPEVKDRIACVNRRLKTKARGYFIGIHSRCQQLIADLEQVHWKTDANGHSLSEIDKSDPKRTHLSDALGYMIEKEFPMKPKAGERPGVIV